MKLNQYLKKPEKIVEASTASATNMELAIVQAWNLERAKYPELEPVAMNIAKMFSGWGFKQGRDKAKHLGSSSNFTVTKDWSKYGAKNPTPKTDFLISRARISLKKSGASQLMSGGKEETKATFHAAVNTLNMDGTPVVNKIEEYINNFINIRSEETVTKTRKIGGKLAEKLISTESIHKEFSKYLSKYFEADPEFAKAVVYEAMSGKTKFGDKSEARAKFILVFDDKKGMDNKWFKIDDPSFIAKMAKDTKIGIRWKSQKRNGKYSIYSTLRLDIKEEFERLVSEHDVLTEGVISAIATKIKAFFRALWNKIRVWLSESIENVLTFLGFEIDMTPVTIKF